MKFIPLLETGYVKNRKEIADLFSSLNKNGNSVSSLYILDEKGVEKNRPSLSLHQYAHRWFDTIVDAGCHHVGDVVDVILAGADIIVIRPTLWSEPDFLTVRDISESKLYVWYDPFEKEKGKTNPTVLFSQADGIVFNAENLPAPIPFATREKIKALITTHDVDHIFVFDPKKIHERELSAFGLNSMIATVDNNDVEGDDL